MSTIFNLITAIALPSISGFLLISILSRKLEISFLEKCSVGYGLGMGIVAFLGFLLGIAGIAFTFISLAVTLSISILFLAILFLLIKKPDQFTCSRRRFTFNFSELFTLKTFGVLLILFWILFKIFFVFFEGMNRPLVSSDALLNLSSGAKFFYFQKGFLLDPSSEHFFAQDYRLFTGHPLLTGFVQIWISNAIGVWSEIYVKAWSPFYFLAILAVLYSSVRQAIDCNVAFLAAFFLSAVPLLSYHGQDGYADLPLAFYALSGTVYLWRYLERNESHALIISGILMGMAAFTKNEGIFYCISAGFVLFAYNILQRRSPWTGAHLFAIPVFLYILPWYIFKMYYGIGFGHGEETSGVTWTQSLHFEVIGLYFNEIFLTANHGLIFSFLIVLGLLRYKDVVRSNIKYIYILIFSVMFMFLFVYITTLDFASVTDRTACNRNTMTFVPIAFFAVALLTGRVFKK